MWKIENMFENRAIEARVQIKNCCADICLKEDAYSVARICCTLGEVRERHFAKIDVKTENLSPDTEIKIYEIYYKDDAELLRQYVDPNRPSLVPAGANRLDIAVLVRGFTKDTVKIYNPTYTELEEYKPRMVRIASLDVTPKLPAGKKRTLQDNLDAALAKIDEVCTKEHPDLVLLTEIFYTLGVELEKPGIDYLRLDSPEVKSLCDMAKKHHTYLSFSIHQTDDNGYYYNSSPLIDREGNIVAEYHKTHLTMKELAAGIIPGDKIVTYDADFGRIGFAICWDLFFPEFVSLAARDGVEIILNPTLGFHADQNGMRAKDTSSYIISSGPSGDTCVIMSPFTSTPLLADGAEKGYAVADIDLNYRYLALRLSAPSAAERINVCKYEANYQILKDYR